MYIFRYEGRVRRMADNYRYKGIWTTSTSNDRYPCNDPGPLFESLVPKLEDLVFNITYAFHTTGEQVVVTPENKFYNNQSVISTTDRKTYGRLVEISKNLFKLQIVPPISSLFAWIKFAS